MTDARPVPGPSPEQQAVIDALMSATGGVAVLAGAGAGKTTTLVTACVELLRRRPDARFAAVSFTERSAADLHAKLSARIADLRPHWVTTIHGLCGSVLREYPREAGFDGEESVLSPHEAQLYWERSVDALFLEEQPVEVERALDELLDRESRSSLEELLRRARELEIFGAVEALSAPAAGGSAPALALLASSVLARYDRFKRRAGAIDFGDLERGADRALGHEHVGRAYQRRFDLVLVDEFQDTNPVQAGIIRRFCRPGAKNLCVVGDPKQSIYRFRDADVTLFEEFCARLPTRLALTWNFRSRPGIIEAVNAVCAPPFEASEMSYEPLVAKREPAPDAQAPVLRLDVTSPEELGRWVSAEVARGVRLEDMALLLRKIRGAEKWLRALTAAGVPLAVGSGGFFWEDPRVRELASFLIWWDEPANALSGAVFLRAPWVGITDARLDAWAKEDPTWAAPFFASEHLLARALKPWHGRTARPGELLLAILEARGMQTEIGAELGAALLGLWHRAEELSSRGLDSHAVTRELARAMSENRRENDVPPPRNLGQLRVLTVHGSKGLEFPHVILVDLGKKPREPDAPLLFWDRARGAYLAERPPEGGRDPRNELEAPWRALEKSKNLAESKRLFYVAMTRAQERLVLVCPELDEKAQGQIEEGDVYATDHWRGWLERAGHDAIARGEIPAAGATTPASVPEVIGTAPKPRVFSARRSRPRHSVTEWTLLSRCPLAYDWRHVHPPVSSSSLGVPLEVSVFEGDGATAISHRELGTRVHACLEHRDFEGLRALESEAGERRLNAQAIIDWAHVSPLMAGGLEVHAELAFEVPVAGEALVGAIDRLLIERAKNRATIVDFKIVGREKAPEALIATYATQMELYAAAVRALEPGLGEIAARLVAISPQGVREVPVALAGVDLGKFAREAASIVARETSEISIATPGDACGSCDFRRVCPKAVHS